MTGEDAHLDGDGAITGDAADTLDRERLQDDETRAALADVRQDRRADR